jgi:hypothetical protein
LTRVPKFKIAHLKQNDVNLIIVPLARGFGELAASDKDQVITELQDRAIAAELNGRVVPVWDGGGQMRFIAPREWHAFFRTLKLRTVRANLNRELDLDQQPDVATTDGSVDVAARQHLQDLIATLDPHEKWPGDVSDKPPLLTRLARIVGLAR